ncbi:MAG: LON peptidase substrate-binding domain-containing protein [Planctomycetota bacterium]
MIVPVFPLPGAYLFPGSMMPLHVFEPRYRAMVEDQLDVAGRLVIAAVPDEHVAELAGSPPLDEVAGLGEIARHEKLPDGRFIIVLAGLGRVRIREIDSPHAYRLVEVLPFDEEEPGEGYPETVLDELRTAVLGRAEGPFELPAEVDLRTLTDLLLMQMKLPQPVMSGLFAEPSPLARARGALEEHRRRP